ncbi:hypothetical protein AX15_000852 [Amanita polypyramis BW_CC]|nr:hypothetical protein AX15_000852 [Amanita polypyramis BW_CC]
MNQNMLRTPSANGYHPSSSSSSSYPVQHRSHLIPQPSQSQWPSSQEHSNRATYPHQQSWANPLQQNLYPNIIPGMNAMNLPFIPQQVIHDALTMSAPVEAADEPTLVQAILSSRNKGETYKDALNSLHGKNGHSASLWKDYYLEHKDRLDAWIAMCIDADAQKTTATTKKPMVAKLKLESSPPPVIKFSPAPSTAKQKQKTMTPHAAQPSRTGGRITQNSLSAPAPVFDDRLPPPNKEIRVPPPPSRSPSPPRQIVPQGRGNKYTSEDREFFIKFISWRLRGNPNLTRMGLCEQLSEKAPHHTPQSWASYWSNHHDLPDKILAAAHGEAAESENEEEDPLSTGEDEDDFPPDRRPKYYESSLSSEEDRYSDDEDDGNEDDRDGDDNDDNDDNDDDDNDDDDAPVQIYDESRMGPKGGPFTEADLYITAKYVAFFSDFENVTARERWEPYHEQHPQRSAKAWAEYYRRNERAIKRLAAKIRRKPKTSRSIDSQRARPSWASDSSRWKRKHDEMGEKTEDGGKRNRGE